MTSSHVGVATDGPGKEVETVALTSDEAGNPTTQRQVVALGDATTFANKAHVDASGNVAVSVSNLPGTQPVSGTVGVSSLPGSPSQEGTDATGVAAPTGGVGIRGWLSGIYDHLGGTLVTSRTWTLGSGTDSVNVGNLPATQPVSGTVTTNDGGTPLTGQALPTGSGIIGWLSRIYVALTGTLTTNATIQGTPSVSVSNLPGTQPVSGTVSVSGTVATTLSGTPAVSVSNFPGTQPVSGTVTSNAGTGTFSGSQKAQTSLTATLCSALTGTGAQASQSLDGYDGAGTLQITAVGTVGAQAVSLQIEGSIDNSNWGIIGTAQIDATANPSYAAANFTLTPGASTISHLYAVRDTVKFIRVNVTANNLGTGLTVSCYQNPV